MRPLLCAYDVILQISLVVVFHWIVGDPWSASDVGARIGLTLPISLLGLWAMRRMGWWSTPAVAIN